MATPKKAPPPVRRPAAPARPTAKPAPKPAAQASRNGPARQPQRAQPQRAQPQRQAPPPQEEEYVEEQPVDETDPVLEDDPNDVGDGNNGYDNSDEQTGSVEPPTQDDEEAAPVYDDTGDEDPDDNIPISVQAPESEDDMKGSPTPAAGIYHMEVSKVEYLKNEGKIVKTGPNKGQPQAPCFKLTMDILQGRCSDPKEKIEKQISKVVFENIWLMESTLKRQQLWLWALGLMKKEMIGSGQAIDMTVGEFKKRATARQVVAGVALTKKKDANGDVVDGQFNANVNWEIHHVNSLDVKDVPKDQAALIRGGYRKEGAPQQRRQSADNVI